MYFVGTPTYGGDEPYGKGIINNTKTVNPTHVGMNRISWWGGLTSST